MNPQPLNIELSVSPDSLIRFTTLLQGGIFIEVPCNTQISALLTSLPGFSRDYVESSVETIFINGLPADSMSQPLTSSGTVLAISAAMPGLAGAIFRKNSVHAALRTAPTASVQTEFAQKTIQVRLKLFNMIAVEKGAQLLHQGCVMKASTVQYFFSYRKQLLKQITEIRVNGDLTSFEDLHLLLNGKNTILLTISVINTG